MSDAKRCDRCGEFWIPKTEYADGHYYIHKANKKDLDLCINCKESLKRWFDDLDKQKSENKNKNALCDNCKNRVYCMMNSDTLVETCAYFCGCYEREE